MSLSRCLATNAERCFPRRKSLQILLVVILGLIAYDLLFGRLITSSPRWIQEQFSPRLQFFAGDVPGKFQVNNFELNDIKLKIFTDKDLPEKEKVQELVNFLVSKTDTHFIDIGTSNGINALAVAKKGRKAIIWPRSVHAGRVIWKAVLANDLEGLVRVVQTPSVVFEAQSKSKTTDNKTKDKLPAQNFLTLLPEVDLRQTVLALDFGNDEGNLQHLIALEPLLGRLQSLALLINWRPLTKREKPDKMAATMLNRLGYTAHASLTTSTSLDTNLQAQWPSLVVWRTSQAKPSTSPAKPSEGHAPNVFDPKAQVEAEFPKTVLKPSADLVAGVSGAKSEVTIYLYNSPDLVSDTVRRSFGWENHIVFPMLQILKKHPDVHFFDFGTFIGVYTLHAANIGKKVVCVDANRFNLHRLAKSVLANKMEDRVILVNNALDSTYGKRYMNVVRSNVGGSHIIANGPKDTAVDAIRADDLLPLITFKRAILKVDIEGFEHQMLAGASRLFSTVDIILIIMEWSPARTTKDRQFIRQFLTSRGFKAYATIESQALLGDDDKKWPFDIVWKRSTSSNTTGLSKGITLAGKNRRIRIFEEQSIPDEFSKHTLKTPAGPATIYTYGSGDLISGSIARTGAWEPGLSAAIHALLQEDKELQMLDLGTNLGVHALTAAKAGRKVVAVDANVSNLKRLRKSVLANNLQDLVKLIWNAIDSTYSTLRMVIPPQNIGGSFMVAANNAQAAQGTEVPTILIDDLLEVINFKKAILKYDIEGREYYGLHNASKLFQQLEIPYVFMEWGVIRNTYKTNGGKKFPEYIINFFESRGYKPFLNIRGAGPLPKNYDTWPWDIIWFKAKTQTGSSAK